MVDDLYTKEYFDEIEGYAKKQSRLDRYYRKIAGQPVHEKVLDVACGHGYLVKRLRESGIKAIGMDFSEHAGKEIQEWFVQHDARKPFPFEDKEFDVVVSTGFFEHLEEQDIDRVKEEMQRVGTIVIAEIGFKQERVTGHTHLTLKDRNWWKEKLQGVKLL